jgi:PhzF family phenazine biosynthesis protein
MIKRPVYLVDSFTEEPLRGNCAAVVLDAGGLDPARMRQIAGELMQAETVFVSGARDPAASFHLRWFTPMNEVRFCGHATLAALHVLVDEAKRLNVPYKPGPAGVLNFEYSTQATNLRAALWRDETGKLHSRIETPPAVFIEHLVTDELVTSLGLIPEVLDPLCVPRRSLGVNDHDGNLFLCVREPETLQRLRPDRAALADALKAAQAGGIVVFARKPKEGVDASLRCYFSDFLPGLAIEDPVTGSAIGQLACLLQYLFPETMPRELRFTQGDELGRPGRVDVVVVPEQMPGQIRAWLGGNARVVLRGELDLRAGAK